MNLPIILATGRDGRMSEPVALSLLDIVSQIEGVHSQIVDVREHALNVTLGYYNDKQIQPWKDMATAADGFIVVIPEYNHSFPGEFKIVWDNLTDEYNHKPVFVCSVSDGYFGGARVMEQLRVLWGCFSMPVAAEVYVTYVSKGVKDKKYINELFTDRVIKSMQALQSYAKAMKVVRSELMK